MKLSRFVCRSIKLAGLPSRRWGGVQRADCFFIDYEEVGEVLECW